MPSAEEFFFLFAGLVAFGVAAIVAFFVSTKLHQLQNKARYMLLMAVYACTAAVYGALFFGQGEYTRPDAVTVYLGRYGVYAATHGFFFAFLTLSRIPNVYAAVLSGSLATGQQVALLLGARSTGSAIWFWFIAAGVCWVVQAVLQVFFVRPKRNADDDDETNDGIAAHLSMKTAVGKYIDFIVTLLIIAGGAIYMFLYVMDAAWQNWGERLLQVAVHCGVDVIVKIIVGLVLLYFVKPIEEVLARNFKFGPLLGEGGDAMRSVCNNVNTPPAQYINE